MAASSNETDEDISNVLDKEDESDVFSEESDDFFIWYKRGRFRQGVGYEQCCAWKWTVWRTVIFFASFCTSRRGASKICICRCKWNERSFWIFFRNLLMKICGNCLLNKQIYTPTNFRQQILIWDHDPEQEVGRIQTWLKWKP